VPLAWPAAIAPVGTGNYPNQLGTPTPAEQAFFRRMTTWL